MKLKRYKKGEPANVRWFGIYIREDFLNGHAPALVIHLRIPWKRYLYSATDDDMKMRYPVWQFFFQKRCQWGYKEDKPRTLKEWQAHCESSK